MRNAVIRELTELAQKNRDIVLLSGDLGFGVLDDFREKMPRQYYNAGICEQNMSSLACGLAMEGKKVYTYSIGNFPTLRCIEQIRNDVCYHNADVTIISVGGGFAYGSLGMSHHATEDIAIMRSLPNMMVFVPADAIEAQIILRKTAELESPCYIRLNKGGEQNIHQSIEELGQYQIGKAIVLTEGMDVCLMSVGAITIEAVETARKLKEKGYSASTYSFPSIKPIDYDIVKACAERYKYIFTIEEHNIIGGFGSAVSEILAELGTGTKLVRIGLKDMYSSVVGSQGYLRHIYEMDSEAIVHTVLEKIEECDEERGKMMIYENLTREGMNK